MKDVPLPCQDIRKRVTDVVREALFGIGVEAPEVVLFGDLKGRGARRCGR